MSGHVTVGHGADVARALAWTQGRLTFEAVPLRDAVPELRRWYDLDFLLADPSLGARRLTASFSDEPVAEVIRLIAMAVEARYERRGRTVTFHSR